MKRDTLLKFLSEGTPESSKRLIAYRSAMVLLIGWCSVTTPICYQGMTYHSVDNGLLTAWTFLAGIIATLAREIYRKADGVAAPPASGSSDGGAL